MIFEAAADEEVPCRPRSWRRSAAERFRLLAIDVSDSGPFDGDENVAS